MKLTWAEVIENREEMGGKELMKMPFDNECCVLKKCCKKYKKKGKYCRSCPKV
ncbi:MAG: hypothetical protein ACJAZY_000094 [Spirosomataceae bacterium]|jgi:hypothetical protein